MYSKDKQIWKQGFVGRSDYRIQPTNRTVRIGFSKLLGKLQVGYILYVSANLGYNLNKRSADLFDDVYAIFSEFVIKAYVDGTHLNCTDLWMQLK